MEGGEIGEIGVGNSSDDGGKRRDEGNYRVGTDGSVSRSWVASKSQLKVQNYYPPLLVVVVVLPSKA